MILNLLKIFAVLVFLNLSACSIYKQTAFCEHLVNQGEQCVKNNSCAFVSTHSKCELIPGSGEQCDHSCRRNDSGICSSNKADLKACSGCKTQTEGQCVHRESCIMGWCIRNNLG